MNQFIFTEISDYNGQRSQAINIILFGRNWTESASDRFLEGALYKYPKLMNESTRRSVSSVVGKAYTVEEYFTSDGKHALWGVDTTFVADL